MKIRPVEFDLFHETDRHDEDKSLFETLRMRLKLFETMYISSFIMH